MNSQLKRMKDILGGQSSLNEKDISDFIDTRAIISKYKEHTVELLLDPGQKGTFPYKYELSYKELRKRLGSQSIPTPNMMLNLSGKTITIIYPFYRQNKEPYYIPPFGPNLKVQSLSHPLINSYFSYDERHLVHDMGAAGCEILNPATTPVATINSRIYPNQTYNTYIPKDMIDPTLYGEDPSIDNIIDQMDDSLINKQPIKRDFSNNNNKEDSNIQSPITKTNDTETHGIPPKAKHPYKI